MKNEKTHRRRALFALEAIVESATSCRKDWKGRTPPTVEEVDAAIRRLSYCVGALKESVEKYVAQLKDVQADINAILEKASK